MFGFIRKRLGYKIMVAMLGIILLVLITEIYMRIYFGTKDKLEIASTISRELADSVYAGIKYPMELGDSEAIKIELTDIRKNAKDVEVVICNFDQEITASDSVYNGRHVPGHNGAGQRVVPLKTHEHFPG